MRPEDDPHELAFYRVGRPGVEPMPTPEVLEVSAEEFEQLQAFAAAVPPNGALRRAFRGRR